MTRLMTLQERYDEYKEEFKRTEKRPDISLLLALLLLKDKDEFCSTGCEVVRFYNANKGRIDLCIEQVMRDFSITVEDLKKENIHIKMVKSLTDEEVKYAQFKRGITFVMTALNCSFDCSPEEMYNKHCDFFGWKKLHQIDVVPYSKLSPLQRKYRQYLNRYNRDKKRPHPAILLLLLMLSEKERFPIENKKDSSLTCTFHNRYQTRIDELIAKIRADFKITDSDMLKYCGLEDSGLNFCFSPQIIDIVFEPALEIVAFENCYHSNWSSEKLYAYRVGDLYSCLGMRFSEQSREHISGFLVLRSDGGGNSLAHPQREVSSGELYIQYKADFITTKTHPHPSELLAALLLWNKDNFVLADCKNSKEFYEKFYREIDAYITCVMIEFVMDENDLADFVSGKQLYSNLGESVCADNVDMVENNYPIENDWEDIKFLVFKPAIETLMLSLKYKSADYALLAALREKNANKNVKLSETGKCRKRTFQFP